MTKKKIVTLALSAVLAVTAIAGASFAYLTDTDSAKNTFTVGNVKIELIEQQRTADGTALEKFVNNKKLYPLVNSLDGTVQGEKDNFGLSTAENYVDKIVTVKNHNENAFVRVYVAVPAALEANDTQTNNILHWNVGNKFAPLGDYTDGDKSNSEQKNNADYDANMGNVVQLDGTTTIDEIEYNVYYMTYKKALAKAEVTGSAFIVGFYLDERVDFNGENYTMNGEVIDFDLSTINIPVFAVGAQQKGFSDADTAINTAFGANYNPWA